MNKLKYVLSQNILLTLYNALIGPHLNYCILAWGFDSKRLHKMQKRAIRIIERSPYYSHSEPIFKKYNLFMVKDVFHLQKLKLYYKLSNRNLPIYFNDFSFIQNNQLHTHNTRTRNNVRQIKFNHEFRKKCIWYEVMQIINTTPSIIKDKVQSHSFSGYCNYIKIHMLNTYSEICHRRNCYSCNHA